MTNKKWDIEQEDSLDENAKLFIERLTKTYDSDNESKVNAIYNILKIATLALTYYVKPGVRINQKGINKSGKTSINNSNAKIINTNQSGLNMQSRANMLSSVNTVDLNNSTSPLMNNLNEASINNNVHNQTVNNIKFINDHPYEHKISLPDTEKIPGNDCGFIVKGIGPRIRASKHKKNNAKTSKNNTAINNIKANNSNIVCAVHNSYSGNFINNFSNISPSQEKLSSINDLVDALPDSCGIILNNISDSTFSHNFVNRISTLEPANHNDVLSPTSILRCWTQRIDRRNSFQSNLEQNKENIDPSSELYKFISQNRR